MSKDETSAGEGQPPTDVLVRRLDGRAQFFDEQPLEASRSNLQKSADLFREAAREIERLRRPPVRADRDAVLEEAMKVCKSMAAERHEVYANSDNPSVSNRAYAAYDAYLNAYTAIRALKAEGSET